MKVIIQETGEIKELIAINPVSGKNSARTLLMNECGEPDLTNTTISQKKFDELQGVLNSLVKLMSAILQLTEKIAELEAVKHSLKKSHPFSQASIEKIYRNVTRN